MAKDFIFETIDPKNPSGPRVDVILSGDLIERFYKHMPVRWENLRAMKYVLDNPERIFFGVRQYNEGGWCYTGRPERWYIKVDIEVPFPKDKVFSVYINPNMRIYECRAELAATDDPANPADWQNRYRGLIWKNTS